MEWYNGSYLDRLEVSGNQNAHVALSDAAAPGLVNHPHVFVTYSKKKGHF